MADAAFSTVDSTVAFTPRSCFCLVTFCLPTFRERSTLRAMNRRTFIGTSIAAAVAASRPAWPAETHHIERVGLQLYTVRDLMKKDFEGTIAKVAQIGYKEVEFAGYYDRSPQAVRAILEKSGLTSPSSHVGYDIVEKKWSEA